MTSTLASNMPTMMILVTLTLAIMTLFVRSWVIAAATFAAAFGAVMIPDIGNGWIGIALVMVMVHAGLRLVEGLWNS